MDKFKQLKRDFIIKGSKLLPGDILEVLVLHHCKVTKDGKTIIIGEFEKLRNKEDKRFVKDLCYRSFKYIEGIGKVFFDYKDLIHLRNLSLKIIKKYERKAKLLKEPK